MNVLPTLYKDVYKESHVGPVRRLASRGYTTFTNRSGKHSNTGGRHVMSFGIQMFIMDYLVTEFDKFFGMRKELALQEHFEIIESMVDGDHSASREALAELHDLGYLPIVIKAIPEGEMVPYGVPTFTIKSTKDGFAWLGQSIETVISCDNWPAQTSATTAFHFLRNFVRAARHTGLAEDWARYQAHDFSMRGLFGRHAAILSGLSHLAAGNYGTDVVPAVAAAREFYGADLKKDIVGKSINATEHFVMCMGAGKDDDIQYYRDLITKDFPTGPLSIVCDSKDFWRVVVGYFYELRYIILGRDGVVVVRPDSGDPFRILCGYSEDEIVYINDKPYDAERVTMRDGWCIPNEGVSPLEPHEIQGLIRVLADIFGTTTNEEGFKVLNPKVGAIYGDSITLDLQVRILERLIDMGFATTVVLGVGSFSYQHVTRDTHGSALKGTAVVYNGRSDWTAIFKDPKTDRSKASQKGLVRVDRIDGEYVMRDNVTEEEEEGGELQVVFKDGQLYNYTTLNEIRARAAKYL